MIAFLCIELYPTFRCGIALALNKLSQYLEESQVTPLFLFFVPDALNDRHAEVRRCMLDAALSALNTHGKVPYLFFFPLNVRVIFYSIRRCFQLCLVCHRTM